MMMMVHGTHIYPCTNDALNLWGLPTWGISCRDGLVGCSLGNIC